MCAEDVAIKVFEDNKEMIESSLRENRFFFEDQLDMVVVRPVEKYLCNIISEKLNVTCLCQTNEVKGEWRTIYFTAESNLSIHLLKELLEGRC